MAEKRNSPYIWVTWLTKVMSGDTTCLWQSWFQNKNKLTEEQSSDFDLVGWKMDHTKMLTELKEKLIKDKYVPIIEKSISYKIPGSDAVICARPDCIIENKRIVTIYDCKTRREKNSDQIQVMLYMYLLSKGKFNGKQIEGIIIYKDKEIKIPNLPENFEENFIFFINRLISAEPPMKNPGDDCKFCKITKNDCPERI